MDDAVTGFGASSTQSDLSLLQDTQDTAAVERMEVGIQPGRENWTNKLIDKIDKID